MHVHLRLTLYLVTAEHRRQDTGNKLQTTWLPDMWLYLYNRSRRRPTKTRASNKYSLTPKSIWQASMWPQVSDFQNPWRSFSHQVGMAIRDGWLIMVHMEITVLTMKRVLNNMINTSARCSDYLIKNCPFSHVCVSCSDLLQPRSGRHGFTGRLKPLCYHYHPHWYNTTCSAKYWLKYTKVQCLWLFH